MFKNYWLIVDECSECTVASMSHALESWSKASCLGLAVRNARWFELPWGKKFSHEISASVWDRYSSSIVIHLGSYDRNYCNERNTYVFFSKRADAPNFSPNFNNKSVFNRRFRSVFSRRFNKFVFGQVFKQVHKNLFQEMLFAKHRVPPAAMLSSVFHSQKCKLRFVSLTMDLVEREDRSWRPLPAIATRPLLCRRQVNTGT
ncbi:hypothetical protein ANN_07966 [Periplaneta americana]|uniref:Uncharacterized protein n=1 Tax=Periplaneta americana TaxID=6978 RepID=A0ABQ8T0R8_PERAM|nr:hypothetical protein ANN_07966 [Periplaneta americana]